MGRLMYEIITFSFRSGYTFGHHIVSLFEFLKQKDYIEVLKYCNQFNNLLFALHKIYLYLLIGLLSNEQGGYGKTTLFGDLTWHQKGNPKSVLVTSIFNDNCCAEIILKILIYNFNHNLDVSIC